MFWFLVFVGGLGAILSIVWYLSSKAWSSRGPAGIAVVLCVFVFVLAWFTPQGKLMVKKAWASGQQGNWLVIDNSGGKTLRHWVLTDSFAESSNQSDGWQFYDDSDPENLCYVSGDAYVMRVNMPLTVFRAHYKKVYNIPEDQEPCSWAEFLAQYSAASRSQ
jgi:hypothetical protein